MAELSTHASPTGRLAACIGLALFLSGSAQAVPILHSIEFTPTSPPGPTVRVGSFEIDSFLLGPANANGAVEFPAVQNFNVAFAGAVWSDLSLAGPPFGDSTEVLVVFLDANGDADDLLAFILDDFFPNATLSELTMTSLAGVGGTFSIASDPVSGTYSISIIPEPAPIALLSAALVALCAARRRSH